MRVFNSSDQSGPSGRDRHPLSLDSDRTYHCPICRHGQMQELTLMDVFACNFCRHIFEVNLEQQTVQVVDSTQPMVWRWGGHRWQPVYQGNWDMTLMLWVVLLALMIVPAGLVAASAYVFPPLEGSTGQHFPLYWAIGTLITHAIMVFWLLAEYYQAPLYVSTKIRLRRWIEQLSGN